MPPAPLPARSIQASKLRPGRGRNLAEWPRPKAAARPKVQLPSPTLQGVNEVGEALSETRGAPFRLRIPESPVPTLFLQHSAVVSSCLCSGCVGGAPPLLPLPHPHSPPRTPPLPFLLLVSSSSSLSLLLEASAPMTHVWSRQSAQWDAHQLLALLHPFIWVKSCSRNVGGTGVGGDRASWRAGFPRWAVQTSG